jgi:hypothetical protein
MLQASDNLGLVRNSYIALASEIKRLVAVSLTIVRKVFEKLQEAECSIQIVAREIARQSQRRECICVEDPAGGREF